MKQLLSLRESLFLSQWSFELGHVVIGSSVSGLGPVWLRALLCPLMTDATANWVSLLYSAHTA